MSVKGFKLDDGSVAKYDYNSLENITTDTTLSSSGVAADAKAVGDAMDDILNIVDGVSDTIGDTGDLETITQISIVDAINEIENRLNGIGTVINSANNSSSISVPNNTWTIIATLTLSPGTWLIIYGCEYTTNTTGDRSVSVTASSTAPTGTTRWTARWNNAAGGPSNKFRVMTSSNTEETTLYLWTTQNSGTSLTSYPCFSAIRIKTVGADSGSSSGGVIENAISELQSNMATLQNTVSGLVTTGTENGWTYRKYSDGTFDMWKRYTGEPATGTHYATNNGFYGYYIQLGNFPTECRPIDTNYCVQSTWQISTGFSFQAGHLGATTTSPGNLYALATASAQSTVTVEMRICGRWRSAS